MLSGGVMAFINCPVELLKVRMQVQDRGGTQRYKNIFDCAWKSLRAEGPIGLFRGLNATLLRDLPSFAGYFCNPARFMCIHSICSCLRGHEGSFTFHFVAWFHVEPNHQRWLCRNRCLAPVLSSRCVKITDPIKCPQGQFGGSYEQFIQNGRIERLL